MAISQLLRKINTRPKVKAINANIRFSEVVPCLTLVTISEIRKTNPNNAMRIPIPILGSFLINPHNRFQ